MPSVEDFLRFLGPIALFLGTVATILKAIVEILKALKELRPSTKYLKYLIVIGTQIIPVGTLVWYFMYWAAENSGRLTEPVIFLLLVTELTIFISLYEFIWGMWFFPKLKLPPVRQRQPAQKLPASNQPSADNKHEPNAESSSGEEYQ